MNDQSPFLPEHFAREDEGPDELFYAVPRLVVHIDEAAIDALRGYFRETLPPGADILDLMSSWRSHLPEDVPYGRVVGLGMNDVELAENPRLTERVLWNLNADPNLPFEDAAFDAVLVTVSVQYLVRPVQVFREVARVLRPGGRVVVSFSNRMFPQKAVRLWRYTTDAEHVRVVAGYLQYAGGFQEIDFQDRSPRPEGGGDPLYIVTARRAAR
ncbi:MAG TPA: class I SAM-dependent methyltransferase [Dehalococcoidia bacterium]